MDKRIQTVIPAQHYFLLKWLLELLFSTVYQVNFNSNPETKGCFGAAQPLSQGYQGKFQGHEVHYCNREEGALLKMRQVKHQKVLQVCCPQSARN